MNVIGNLCDEGISTRQNFLDSALVRGFCEVFVTEQDELMVESFIWALMGLFSVESKGMISKENMKWGWQVVKNILRFIGLKED